MNFSRLPQSFSLASTGYEIVLCGGQSPFKEEQFELCCSAGFSGHQKPGDDSTEFRQFVWERDALVAPLIDQQLKRQVEQYNVFIFSNGIYLSKWKPTWNHM